MKENDEYVRAMSNSPNGILVEVCLYGEGHRVSWLIGRASSVLDEMSRSSVSLGSFLGVYGWDEDEFDRLFRELDQEKGKWEGD